MTVQELKQPEFKSISMDKKTEKLLERILYIVLIVLGVPFIYTSVTVISSFYKVYNYNTAPDNLNLSYPVLLGLLILLAFWIIAVIDCLIRKLSPTTKTAWLLIIFLFQPGAFIYWFSRKHLPVQEVGQVEDKKINGTRIIALIIFIIIWLVGLIYYFKLQNQTTLDKTKESKVSAMLSQIKKEANNYRVANETYLGFKESSSVNDALKEQGFELSKSITKDSYVFYAKNENKTYCIYSIKKKNSVSTGSSYDRKCPTIAN